MNRAILWKEYREQRWVWLCIAFLGCAWILGFDRLFFAVGAMSAGGFATEEGREASFSAPAVGGLVLARMYALVCGSMLLAGEREARTAAFLDGLRVARRELWRGKVWAGVTLLVGLVEWFAALLLAEVWRVQAHDAWLLASWGGLVLVLAAVAAEALAWALFFSARCGSLLASVACAALTLLAVHALTFVLAGTESVLLAGAFLVLRAGAAGSALWGSRTAYLGQRRAREPEGARGPVWSRTLWLIARQQWRATLTIGALGVAVGVFLPRFGIVLWPAYGLVLGVVFGMLAFGPDKAEDSKRFLACQRLPLGRLWEVKNAASLGAVLAVALLVLGVSVAAQRLRLQVSPLRYSDFDRASDLRPVREFVGRALESDRLFHAVDPLAFLLIWTLYGFAVSQLLTLLARKNIVAFTLALVVAPAPVVLWLPSLVSDGLPLWCLLVAPCVILLASRLAVWPWAADRIGSMRVVRRIIACVLLAAAWPAAVFAYRAWHLPDLGEPFHVPDLVMRLPSGRQNRSGELIHRALAELVEQEKKASAEVPHFTAQDPSLGAIVQNGARPVGTTQAVWLDHVFQGAWLVPLREGVTLPPGMIWDPRSADTMRIRYPYDLDNLLPARALQLQAGGHASEALDHLVLALGLSRHLRSWAVSPDYWRGNGVEQAAAEGLYRWLVAVGPRPELIGRAVRELTRHEREVPPMARCRELDFLYARARWSGRRRSATPRRMSCSRFAGRRHGSGSDGAGCSVTCTRGTIWFRWRTSVKDRLTPGSFSPCSPIPRAAPGPESGACAWSRPWLFTGSGRGGSPGGWKSWSRVTCPRCRSTRPPTNRFLARWERPGAFRG